MKTRKILFCLMAVTALAKPTLGAKEICNVDEIISAHCRLGVPVPNPGEEIDTKAARKAHKKSALRYHPDKTTSEKKDLYTKIFSEYNQAIKCFGYFEKMPSWVDSFGNPFYYVDAELIPAKTAEALKKIKQMDMRFLQEEERLINKNAKKETYAQDVWGKVKTETAYLLNSAIAFVQEIPSKVMSFVQIVATGFKSFFNALPPMVW